MYVHTYIQRGDLLPETVKHPALWFRAISCLTLLETLETPPGRAAVDLDVFCSVLARWLSPLWTVTVPPAKGETPSPAGPINDFMHRRGAGWHCAQTVSSLESTSIGFTCLGAIRSIIVKA